MPLTDKYKFSVGNILNYLLNERLWEAIKRRSQFRLLALISMQ